MTVNVVEIEGDAFFSIENALADALYRIYEQIEQQ